ncbi:MAG: hypothetical protein IT372_18200, partial [Polyangiaceae bacterium]|nr:hypothetical protein [Polyangiaceae bacterium]
MTRGGRAGWLGVGVACARVTGLCGCSGDETGDPGPGGGGGTPAGCVPSENADPVGDCGVFVSSSLGDDANDGTKAAPVRTLGKALTLAGFGDRRVYACAEQFDEAIQVLPGIAIYGGL